MRPPNRPGNPVGGQGSIAVWILLGLTLGLFLAPPLLRGEVIYPHDNRAEAGEELVPFTGLDWAYQDVVALYVPEAAAHLAGDHDSWLATWNPHNELGRPLFQAYTGPCFILAHALSWLSRDPFVHYTWMAVLAVILTAVFAQGFLLQKQLHPLAAWAGAIGISVGPLYPAWGMLPLIQWGYCWAFGCLWFFERWLRNSRRRDLAAVGFCVHAILLSGFPQHILGLGWMVSGWMLLQIYLSPASWGNRWRRVGALSFVTLLALLSVVPSFLDLFLAWQKSTRADNVLPWSKLMGGYKISGLIFPDPQDGTGAGQATYSLGAIYSLLALIGAARLRWGGYWALWAFALVFGLHFLFFFRVFVALGMSFSSWHPIFLLHLPAAILAALGADWILRCKLPGRSLAQASVQPRPRRASAILIVVAILYSATGAPQELLLWQPRESIKTDSELAQVLRSATANGSRFAVVGKPPNNSRWLPPNMEIVLGLDSLQSYYHVPSRKFHRWIQPLRSAKHDGSYDRRFLQVSSLKTFSEEILALAGISTLVSFTPLKGELVSETVRIGPAFVSRVHQPGPLQALIPVTKLQERDSRNLQFSPEDVRAHALQSRLKTGVHDRIELEFEATGEERVLFLSQQFHPHWVARDADHELRTVLINDLFQGVIVPAHVSGVELRFLPNARWMWIPQALIALGLIAILLFSIRRRVRRRLHGPAPPQ